MELKRVLKELELINDLNNNSLDNLKEKYLKDEETYNAFSKEFYTLFATDTLYQLRVSKQYEKIANLLLRGANKFPSKENFDIRLEVIDIMAYNLDKYKLRDVIKSGEHQAKAIFFGSFDYNIPYNVTYEDLLLGIQEGAEKYLAKKTPTRDFLRKVPKRINEVSCGPKDVETIIDDYALMCDGISLCNDMSFLYFSNYMLSFYSNTVDENFKKEIESTIKASFLLQKLDYYDKEDFDIRSYNKLAKSVMSKLKVLDKTKTKEENREIRKAKRKQFFTKHINE